jgi:ParB family chromosome partitioning protein
MSATHAPLSSLSIDDNINVRKTGRGAEPQYVASIREKGVIQAIVVRQNKNNGFTITDGGKRYSALVFLKEKGETANGVLVTDDYQVPVVVRPENDADARDTSLITNVVRTDMHPADECEAFFQLVQEGRTPAGIAATYGLDKRHVEQRLALGGKLSPTIRQAWKEHKLDDEQAQAFTLAPDHKSQDALFNKLSKRPSEFRRSDIVNELKIKSDVGRMLQFVGIAAYETRKGKVTMDLFGSDHRVSNEKLLHAMVGEKLDATADRLVKEDGWAWASVVKDNHGQWDYGRIAHLNLTREDQVRRNDLYDRLEGDALSEEVAAELRAEIDRIDSAAVGRTFKPAQRAQSGCFVAFGRDGQNIDYGRTKPEEKKKAAAAERAAERQKTVKAAEKTGVGIISNALHQRLSEQLTAAAAKTLAGDGALALAALLAGFASGGQVVCVRETGLATKQAGYVRPRSTFEGALRNYLDGGHAAMMESLAQVAAKAIDMQARHIRIAPLKDSANVALLGAMDPTIFAKAMREAFDDKDYFNCVSKAVALKAIAEAVNPDEARKLDGKPKAEVTKFAITNVPKSGWLPPELRTVHYTGPGVRKLADKAKGKTPTKKVA